MLGFKLWLEEHDLSWHEDRDSLRKEIIKTLEPNIDAANVASRRIGDFGSDDDVTSRHGRHILNLFNKNPLIWKLMAKAFPGEEETLKNKVAQWLKESKPEHQIADLFNMIGIGDEPIVNHATPKPKQQQEPQQSQQPPAAANQQAPGIPQPAPMPTA